MTTPDLGLLRRLDNAQERYVPLPPGSAGAVVIDVERARAAVQQLQVVIDDIRDARGQLDAGRLESPAGDAISRNATAAAVQMVAACRVYLEAWSLALTNGLKALQQQISSYEDAERQIGRRA